jgi:signal transduction histidine kinase
VRRLQNERALQETFSRRLIESQEVERKRMAAELHDSLGQTLLVLNNYAGMALNELANPEKLRARLGKIRDSAAGCIEEVRGIARALRPYQLDRFGLTKTLEDIADTLAETARLEVVAEIDNVDGLFSPPAEISIYRVAQEWLNNVIKHAQASKARLMLRRENSGLHLILEDNGVGFDYDAAMARRDEKQSFGLVNLRERVRLLGGTIEFDTAVGRGTRLTLQIPYENAHHTSHRG